MNDILTDWIGRPQTEFDIADEGRVAALAALLDHAQPPWSPGELPPLAHWLHFQPHVRQSQLGVDGHPVKGGFLPPVPLPRRMWVASRVEFCAPIPFGEKIERHSTIADIKHREGATGPLIFVTIMHRILVGGQLAVEEEQDIVYRDAETATPPPAPEPHTVDHCAGGRTRIFEPDPIVLFRYSALTFNSHRIHYDHDYATSQEQYPGLVVQGPLTATLLMDHYLRDPALPHVTRFSFRARRPLFSGNPIKLRSRAEGGRAFLEARDPSGEIAMEAIVA